MILPLEDRVRTGGKERKRSRNPACFGRSRESEIARYAFTAHKSHTFVSFRICLQRTGANIRCFKRTLPCTNRSTSASRSRSCCNSNNHRSNRRIVTSASAERATNNGMLCGGTSSTNAARIPGFSAPTAKIERSNAPTCTRTSSTCMSVSRFTRSTSSQKNKR